MTRRITDHPVLGPAPQRRAVRFTWNGQALEGMEGEPIAAALLANGERTLRFTDRHGLPRGVYCNIGHCYECRVTVDGMRSVRACITPLRDGMAVEQQDGAGKGDGH